MPSTCSVTPSRVRIVLDASRRKFYGRRYPAVMRCRWKIILFLFSSHSGVRASRYNSGVRKNKIEASTCPLNSAACHRDVQLLPHERTSLTDFYCSTWGWVGSQQFFQNRIEPPARAPPAFPVGSGVGRVENKSKKIIFKNKSSSSRLLRTWSAI